MPKLASLVVVRDGTVYAGTLPANKLPVVQHYVARETEALLARWDSYGGG